MERNSATNPRKTVGTGATSSGRRSRQLLRNIEHTAAVHGFMAALAEQARSLGWEIVPLDPPHRASRHFRHGDRLRSIHPDAFGVLRRGGATWNFFLEWERRTVRPKTMADRLAPYLRYYSTTGPPTTMVRSPLSCWYSTTTWRRPTSCGWRRSEWSRLGSTSLCWFPTRGY